MAKRIAFAAVCAAFILLSAVLPAFAGSGLSGSGTSSDPYRIASASDLKQISSYLNKSGVYFKQTKDISLSSEKNWTPIGTEKKPFKGVYDGGEYQISFLTVQTEEETEGVGLFGYVSGATFQNVTLKSVSVDGPSLRYVGALAGSAEKSRFSGCAAEADINGGYGYVGGLVGYATECSFESCSADVSIDANAPVGGIAGVDLFGEDSKAGTIKNCSSSGTILTSGEAAGGLFGRVQAPSDCEEKNGEYVYSTKGTAVSNCSSSVSVKAREGGTVSCAGGLIGSAECVDVSDCGATGSVEGDGKNFGGLIGEFEGGVGSVQRCFATGEIKDFGSGKAYGAAFAGGLIGWSRGARISDCYATGDVYSGGGWSDCQDDYMASGGVWVRYRNPAGSLIGCLHFSYSDTKFYLTRCYATGTVTAPYVCTDEKSYCNGSLVGYVFDDLMRKYIIDTSKKDQTDLSGFSDTTVGSFDANYCAGDLRTYYVPVSKYERGTIAYTGYQPKYVMPQITYVTNIQASQLTSRDTFAGFDFEKVWEMTENGPALRGRSSTTDPGTGGNGGKIEADLNGDGRTDGRDYLMLKRIVLGTLKPDERQKALTDVSRDGFVNSKDYMILKRVVLGTYKG